VRLLEANHEQVLPFVSEPTYNVWRLFMSGSAHGFTTGRLNLIQAVLVKSHGQVPGLPLRRSDRYGERPEVDAGKAGLAWSTNVTERSHSQVLHRAL
jgi:hypothetical protein